jgi:predicted nucleotide-binding protein
MQQLFAESQALWHLRSKNMTTKPSVFIGSSSEGLEFARAVRAQLNHDAEITMWNEGFFGLGRTFIETLINESQRFDFAILVLTPDDLVQSREAETFGPRDNVIFELGLFMGCLGRERTFILHQAHARLKIPSDLAGVTTATYDWPRDDEKHIAAVGAACDSIRGSIREKGVSERKTIKQISDLKEQVEEQQVIINKLAEKSISDEAFHHLAGITILHEYKYWQNEKVGDLFQRQLYFLKDRGFIEPPTLEFFKELDGTNMVGKAIPTETGKMYVKLRKDDIPKDWLSTDPKKRSNLNTDVVLDLGFKLANDGTIS